MGIVNKKIPTSELIKMVQLVAKHGIQKTSVIQGVSRQTVYNYVGRLENQLGYKIFAPYGYGYLTWQGKQFLDNVD
jgi:hypothetical protein